MDWDKIRLFYHVAKAGSFSLAAQHLNMTQPPLSRSIEILEHSVKAKLFHRHARGVTLTKEGELLFEKATHMYDTYENAISLIQDDQDLPAGPLRILTTSGLAHIWFLEDIINFSKQYPNIKLSVIGTDSAVDFSVNNFDIAIRPEIHNRKDLIQEHFMTFHDGLYASLEYLTRFGEPKTLEDLNSHRLLAFSHEQIHPYSELVNHHLTGGLERGQRRNTHMAINSSSSLIRAAEEGLGIISMPKNHPLILKSSLVPILAHVVGPVSKAFFIYSKQMAGKKRITLFIEYLKNRWVSKI